jgi:hypothetical protein
MDFGQTHRVLGRVDIDPLLERICTVDPALWDADEHIRRQLTQNRPTRAIFLYYSDPRVPPAPTLTQDDVRRCVGWDWFSPAVQPIIETILRHYPRESVVMMCQIANLKPGGHIAKHFDAAPLLCASHRVHVPLITWPEVAFYIDDQAHHFEAAVAFELNNQRLHEVHHRGTRDRLHLILDVLPGSFDRVHGRWAFAESPASPAGHL